MMTSSSEITQEQDEEENQNPYFIKSEIQKKRIRQIIQYQKSLYCSSSSMASTAASSSSISTTSSRSSSLLQLMKRGNTSLKRLFDMEHISLSTHLQDYSGSPIIKSIPLWGSDTDGESVQDFWAHIKQTGTSFSKVGDDETDHSRSGLASDGSSFMVKDIISFKVNRRPKRLTRKKSFRKLPGFRLRLRRLRIMICGRKF